jgi:hypothetical protein
VPVQSPLGGLRTPETGLRRFLLQRARLLRDRPALVDGARDLAAAAGTPRASRATSGKDRRAVPRQD